MHFRIPEDEKDPVAVSDKCYGVGFLWFDTLEDAQSVLEAFPTTFVGDGFYKEIVIITHSSCTSRTKLPCRSKKLKSSFQ